MISIADERLPDDRQPTLLHTISFRRQPVAAKGDSPQRKDQDKDARFRFCTKADGAISSPENRAGARTSDFVYGSNTVPIHGNLNTCTQKFLCIPLNRS